MAAVARKRKLRLPADTSIEAEVDLNLNPAHSACFRRAPLDVSPPGVARESAQAMVNEADGICP
jgi:organic hydroperoxide reductase OsmC/OhrA